MTTEKLNPFDANVYTRDSYKQPDRKYARIHHLIALDQKQTVSYIQTTDINYCIVQDRANYNRAPLHIAVMAENAAAVEALVQRILQESPKQILATDLYGLNALHYASLTETASTMTALFQKLISRKYLKKLKEARTSLGFSSKELEIFSAPLQNPEFSVWVDGDKIRPEQVSEKLGYQFCSVPHASKETLWQLHKSIPSGKTASPKLEKELFFALRNIRPSDCVKIQKGPIGWEMLARKQIPQNTLIWAPYGGEFSAQDKTSPYYLPHTGEEASLTRDYGNGLVILPTDKFGGIGHLINDGPPNVSYKSQFGFNVVSMCEIKIGETLLIDYGYDHPVKQGKYVLDIVALKKRIKIAQNPKNKLFLAELIIYFYHTPAALAYLALSDIKKENIYPLLRDLATSGTVSQERQNLIIIDEALHLSASQKTVVLKEHLTGKFTMRSLKFLLSKGKKLLSELENPKDFKNFCLAFDSIYCFVNGSDYGTDWSLPKQEKSDDEKDSSFIENPAECEQLNDLYHKVILLKDFENTFKTLHDYLNVLGNYLIQDEEIHPSRKEDCIQKSWVIHHLLTKIKAD